MSATNFAQIARLPVDDDNVAIATRDIEAGTEVVYGDSTFTVLHTVMEGHRFAATSLRHGDALTSWGLPFGKATRNVSPGEYICNAKILQALAERHVSFAIPAKPNFEDHLERYEVNQESFVAGKQIEPLATPGTFMGFKRSARRGVGTRNFIVVMGTTSRAGPFAQAIADSFNDVTSEYPNVDGVCAIVHTEGGGTERPNNLDFVLRALSGFMVHANVGAVLAVDYGTEAYTNDDLQDHLNSGDYPLGQVKHAFMRVSSALGDELNRAQELISAWLPEVNQTPRTPQPLSAMKIALQCGGSDAFSGVSGNALAGWVAKEAIRNGGSANLAETDELIGAEPYVLSNVRDLETAETFLRKIEIFKQRAANHGATAEGNPSGGNNYRGLYNIALKSIGAARKRDPEVRLDYVIDYAAPMAEPGYYFMDSPGNDLESIAGQVASGSNLILFITGNGSVTNFPFVPTLKFVTTTGRFNMLANEMDVNAGRYNDGMSMDDLGRETFDLAVDVISGQRSKGEVAGHSQVSLWRNWSQTEAGQVATIKAKSKPDGMPLAIAAGPPSTLSFEALATSAGPSTDQIGLIMPTSLCSGQVARLVAQHLNDHRTPDAPVSQYVSLVHTEGCGSVNAEDIYLRTLLGHVRHRRTWRALLLEHGCEKTHNDAVHNYLTDLGHDTSRFGWASVQLDGGLANVTQKVADWFAEQARGDNPQETETAGAANLTVALSSEGGVAGVAGAALGEVARRLVAAGATVVVNEKASLLDNTTFVSALLAADTKVRATLEYGGWPLHAGLHVMQSPTTDALEIVTGLGATGADIVLHYVGTSPFPLHPMIPVVQVSVDPKVAARFESDLDVSMDGSAPVSELVGSLEALLADTASRLRAPRLHGKVAAGFQLTRGLLGISL
jgi:altronate dehydratase